MIKRFLLIALFLTNLFTINPYFIKADDDVVIATMDIEEINNFGNVTLKIDDRNLSYSDLEEKELEYGDIVTVKFLDQEINMPVVKEYSEGRVGSAILRATDVKVTLAINTGDFASSYLADRHEDGENVSWTYKQDIETPVVFEISIYKKGAYYEEYGYGTLEYTNDRNDYPELDDEQFANFRVVNTTGMGRNILYRTSSPIDPVRQRNIYADKALEKAKVKTIMNLANSQDDVIKFEGYKDSYYAKINSIPLNMGLSYTSDSYKEKLRKGLEFFIENEGPYAVQCKEGKDRTGFVIALLECFMGASYDEVVSDYMLSFYNFYGIDPDDDQYNEIVDNNIKTTLQNVFAVENLQECDLQAEAKEYLESIGLDDNQLETLRNNLSDPKINNNPYYVIFAVAALILIFACVYFNKRNNIKL